MLDCEAIDLDDAAAVRQLIVQLRTTLEFTASRLAEAETARSSLPLAQHRRQRGGGGAYDDDDDDDAAGVGGGDLCNPGNPLASCSGGERSFFESLGAAFHCLGDGGGVFGGGDGMAKQQRFDDTDDLETYELPVSMPPRSGGVSAERSMTEQLAERRQRMQRIAQARVI